MYLDWSLGNTPLIFRLSCSMQDRELNCMTECCVFVVQVNLHNLLLASVGLNVCTVTSQKCSSELRCINSLINFMQLELCASQELGR